ncbi:hypothetical protein MRX96_026206 [Rhipicephalus microplus]
MAGCEVPSIVASELVERPTAERFAITAPCRARLRAAPPSLGSKPVRRLVREDMLTAPDASLLCCLFFLPRRPLRLQPCNRDTPLREENF